MKYNLSLFLITIIFNFPGSCQKPLPADYRAYIDKYCQLAVREMKLYKIPASITLAQGLIESNCGKSPLALDANNHFGIKCHKEWTGEGYYYDDDEKHECFRKYASPEESFRDHSLFLVNRPRYAALFSLDPRDYTGWAYGLKQAGYATNPDYPRILIRMIEDNRLTEFDNTEFIQLPVATATEVVSRKIPLEQAGNMLNTEGELLFFSAYKMPDPGKYQVVKMSGTGRKIYSNNGVSFIFAEASDQWNNLAKEFRMFVCQIYRDNDLKESDPITPGQILYLAAKKKKGAEVSHRVCENESLYSISQESAVKLRLLCKYNGLKTDSELKPGTTIRLRKK